MARSVTLSFVSIVLVCCTAACNSQRQSELAGHAPVQPGKSSAKEYVGFDLNGYPGDTRLAELHRTFAFIGYWLNTPPGADGNTWVGKRAAIRQTGLGFLVLWNGRLDVEILKQAKGGTRPAILGKMDASAAVAAAQREGFPAGTTIFLDQEEGGRLLEEQSAYFFGWTEAVAASSYRPGAYLSGQPAPDGRGPDGKPATITTAEDVKQKIVTGRLHPVALWVAQDSCPPAPGCTLMAPPLRSSGTQDAVAWQYAQSPRRPEITRSCAATYAPDGNCYAGVSKDLFLDLNVAGSPDPSHGR